MKKLRKLGSVILALVMICVMSITAFAADDTQYIITINNSTDGYVYTAYQIFAGDLSEDGKILSNVTWGGGITEEGIAAVKTEYGTDDAAEVAALITTEAKAEEFAEFVGSYLTSGTASTDAGDTYTITVTGAGYYLIDNTEVPAENGAYTSYILKVVSNVSTDPKSAIPSSDKTVDDINDSTETEVTTGESADHDIGDNVTFTLSATLPTNYGDYKTYKLIFHDVMESGLTFNNDVVVTVGDTVVDPSCYTVSQSCSDGCTFEVIISDTHALKDTDGNAIAVSATSVITVTYTAELNENCVVGNPGNYNTMHIEYSNNPNWDGDGEGPTGETPDDTVVVFTYKLTANKVDSTGAALAGAGFTLYKYDAESETYVAVGEEVTGGTSFTWTGLDDGRYKLVETTTPSGYNTMDDLYFTVAAEHAESGITSLVIKDADDNVISGEDLSFTATATGGAISTNITNYKGSELPDTGGIGTTIFYVVGGVLVLGAAVLLITRRRMDKAE
ncbi:MAG: isopeptide-forming domain-containing fimbrial protein [Clostridiales bacterium]|nr:isopeptide-forming domain-containing fimbrial protein [Clostridiales bacterium]